MINRIKLLPIAISILSCNPLIEDNQQLEIRLLDIEQNLNQRIQKLNNEIITLRWKIEYLEQQLPKDPQQECLSSDKPFCPYSLEECLHSGKYNICPLE